MNLNLSADEVLTTTRAVRKRLDLSRKVEPEIIRECLEIAIQAPTGSNRQIWHFVVLTDPGVISRMGDLYRRSMPFAQKDVSVLPRIVPSDPALHQAQSERMYASAAHFAEIIDRVPGMLVPCVEGAPPTNRGAAAFSLVGSVVQAAWSFMLAARNRGIGTVWTTVHLALEEEAAEIMGIPYPDFTQIALIPFGYTIGTSFKPAQREPLDRVVHWNKW